MKIRAIASMAVLLAACSTTEVVYTPPETEQGKACVQRCQADQVACRRDQDVRAERAKHQCQAEADRRESACRIQAPLEYAACLKFAKTDADRAACALEECTQPSCYATPQYGLCEGDFRFCYQNCGGRIDVIER